MAEEATWDDLWGDEGGANPPEGSAGDPPPPVNDWGEETDEEKLAREEADAKAQADEAASKTEGPPTPVTVEDLSEEELAEKTKEAEDAGITVEELLAQETEGPELSGVEQYLAQFNIEGGMIEFDDGESVHFDELDPQKQVEILTGLQDAQKYEAEKQYGLDEAEVALVNKGREFDGGIEAYIQSEVSARLLAEGVGGTDIDAMSDDVIMLKALEEKRPDATQEDLSKQLESIKKGEFYKDQVEFFRGKMKSDEDAKAVELQLQEDLKFDQEVELQRKQVVHAAEGIKDIGGVPIDDVSMNKLLSKVLELNDSKNSVFLTEVFSDPKNLLQAAHWFYNGADILKQTQNQAKKDKSSAYKRGRESALGRTTPNTRRNFTKPASTTPSTKVNESETTWDDFD